MALTKTSFIKVDATESFTDSAELEVIIPAEKIVDVTSDFITQYITIVFTDTTVTVSGTYPLSVFNLNNILHITRGSSDKYETPEATSGFDISPITRQIISYVPDSRNTKLITYTITTDTASVYTITQLVWNNYSIGRDALKEFV